MFEFRAIEVTKGGQFNKLLSVLLEKLNPVPRQQIFSATHLAQHRLTSTFLCSGVSIAYSGWLRKRGNRRVGRATARSAREDGWSRPRRGAAQRRGGTRPHGREISKSEAASGRRENVLETGREHFARSAPVQAFERTIVEHVVVRRADS